MPSELSDSSESLAGLGCDSNDEEDDGQLWQKVQSWGATQDDKPVEAENALIEPDIVEGKQVNCGPSVTEMEFEQYMAKTPSPGKQRVRDALAARELAEKIGERSVGKELTRTQVNSFELGKQVNCGSPTIDMEFEQYMAKTPSPSKQVGCGSLIGENDDETEDTLIESANVLIDTANKLIETKDTLIEHVITSIAGIADGVDGDSPNLEEDDGQLLGAPQTNALDGMNVTLGEQDIVGDKPEAFYAAYAGVDYSALDWPQGDSEVLSVRRTNNSPTGNSPSSGNSSGNKCFFKGRYDSPIGSSSSSGNSSGYHAVTSKFDTRNMDAEKMNAEDEAPEDKAKKMLYKQIKRVCKRHFHALRADLRLREGRMRDQLFLELEDMFFKK
jgi:hypothetical protein